MPRAGLDRQRVLAEAAAIADAEGLPALTFARLASALKVKPPSLYNHVASLEAVLEALTAQGLRELLAASGEVPLMWYRLWEAGADRVVVVTPLKERPAPPEHYFKRIEAVSGPYGPDEKTIHGHVYARQAKG